MILLDTSAVIWLDRSHPRTRKLPVASRSLYVSPATMLELRFLEESQRIRFRRGSIQSVMDDDRWSLDDPPAAAWFERALALGSTRDPFDRLISAHVLLRRWKLATSDETLIEHLGPAHTFPL
jgi:predicted nucleic acid-binding protein